MFDTFAQAALSTLAQVDQFFVATETRVIMQTLWVFAACIALALLEIEIEGPNGWAKNLPTWRGQPTWAKPNNKFFALIGRVFSLASGGNQLTGYHLALMSVLFFLCTMPALYAEHVVWAFVSGLGHFFMMSVTWDFLWFVFNPAYGIRRFSPAYIKWHPNWLGPMPMPYPGGILFGAILVVTGNTGSLPSPVLVASVCLLHVVGAALCVALALKMGIGKEPKS